MPKGAAFINNVIAIMTLKSDESVPKHSTRAIRRSYRINELTRSDSIRLNHWCDKMNMQILPMGRQLTVRTENLPLRVAYRTI